MDAVENGQYIPLTSLFIGLGLTQKSPHVGVSYDVQSIMTLLVSLPINTHPSQYRHVWLRAIVCRDVKSDVIIGSPSIQFYDLMPILNTDLKTKVCCEICAIPTKRKRQTGAIVATVTICPTGHIQGDAHSAIVRHQDGPLPILLPPHHSTYTEPMATIVAEINAVADTTYLPTYTDPLYS